MSRSGEDLRLGTDGAELRMAALDASTVASLLRVVSEQAQNVAGVRLFGLEGLEGFLGTDGVVGAVAAGVMQGAPQPVRAILFDKTSEANWSLAWHQDRVIAVRERVDVEGFGPWTLKHGVSHVAPPFEVLGRMFTLRVHLDDVSESNAPLLVSPGSHLNGRIAEADIPEVVERSDVRTCLAEAGDIWIYSTPILHASERARAPRRRRVLQVDYASDRLPHGLQWLGV